MELLPRVMGWTARDATLKMTDRVANRKRETAQQVTRPTAATWNRETIVRSCDEEGPSDARRGTTRQSG